MNQLMLGLKSYEKIVDKELHYVYRKNGKYEEIVFKPIKSNFMHLCGVEYKDPNSGRKYKASAFYNALKNKKLSPHGIQKKQDGTTDQKLQVINNLKDLISCNSIRVIDDRITLLNVTMDAGIRSRRAVFCLALNWVDNGFFAPISLLDVRRQQIKPGYEVHCIYYYDMDAKKHKTLCKTPEFNEYEEKNTYRYVN